MKSLSQRLHRALCNYWDSEAFISSNFWLYTSTVWIRNQTMTGVKVKTVSFILRVFSSISGEPFLVVVVQSPILGEQKYWDKFTYVCFKVV
jgi:hypothetical protein